MAYEELVNSFTGSITFDANKSRLNIGGTEVAFHCDKFNTRILKNMEDVMGYEPGGKLLREMAEHTTFALLKKFLLDGPGAAHFSSLDPSDKVASIFELFKVLAYGALDVTELSASEGKFTSKTSYLAAGWLENQTKWNWEKRQKPACHDICGHIAATMAIVFGKPQGSYSVKESSCRAAGAAECIFVAKSGA